MPDKKQSYAENAVKKSFFIRFLTIIADWFYKAVSQSAIAGFFTSRSKFDEKIHKSFVYNKIISPPLSFLRKSKIAIAKQVEKSVIFGLLSETLDNFLNSSLRSFGAGLLAYGAVSFVIGAAFIKGGIEEILSLKFGVAVGIAFCGLLLLFYKKNIATGVYESFVFRFFFVSVAGFRPEFFTKHEKSADKQMVFLVIGGLLGLLTLFIPVYYIPLAAVALILGLTLLKSPEFGVICVLFCIPFLPTMMLAALCAATFIAFLLKLAIGRRSMKADGTFIFTVLFAFTIAVSAFNSHFRASSLQIAMLYYAFISAAIVAANTIKTKKLMIKAVTALLTGGLLSAALGVYQRVVGLEKSLVWVDTTMFKDIGTRVIGSFDNPNVFGEFLVMLLPMAIAVFFLSKRNYKILSAALVAVLGAALIFTYSRGAWLGGLFSVVIFLCFYSINYFKFFLSGFLLVPFIPKLLPSSILNRFGSIGDMADTSTSYRVSIWQAAVKMMNAFWATGIGLGSQNFTYYYPAFALSGAQFALHSHNLYFQLVIEIGALGLICFLCAVIWSFKNAFIVYKNSEDKVLKFIMIALACGIVAVLVQALTDNIWYNYRIFLSFWMLIGLLSGGYKCFRENCEAYD